MSKHARTCALLAGALLLAGARGAMARDRVTCVTIRTDETVASVAKRVTGDARNMQAPWFQIVNPITSRPVPKARYGFLFAGWNACAPPRRAAAGGRERARRPGALDRAPRRRCSGGSIRPVAPPAPALVLWASAGIWSSLALALAFICWLIDDRLAGRQDTVRAMKHYAERFVAEFERPLQQPHRSQRPIQSRVRFKPGRARFDVMLAPDAGLRYPNLTDHKSNVMYDVVRIQRALSEQAFVSSRPYARGRWVVVPFRFRVGTKEAGGTCDSFS